jgi:hypothetical protein
MVAIMGNVPLGIGAVSYAGTWSIGIAGDSDAFPDIEGLAAGVREELSALGVEATMAGEEERLGIITPIDTTSAIAAAIA